MPEYGEPKYWDERYAQNKGSMFDWLESYATLKDVLAPYLKPEFKILIIGCGNANFSEDLYDAGFQNIWNIDISSVVIKQMKIRNVQRKKMKY
jgi:EEF1A lysine methyltransferase 4